MGGGDAMPATVAPSVRDVLRARARDLAEVRSAVTPAETLDVLTFRLADERFAVESRFVLGVFRVHTLCALPPAASPLVGITEWRGDLVTLLDLQRVLGHAAPVPAERGVALALGDGHPSFGVLVDAVLPHQAISPSAIAPPPPASPAILRYVRGITDDAVLLLDAVALLAMQLTPPNAPSHQP